LTGSARRKLIEQYTAALEIFPSPKRIGRFWLGTGCGNLTES
jgi:hypothetical protein